MKPLLLQLGIKDGERILLGNHITNKGPSKREMALL
jgi:hypothetical protein